MLITLGDKNKYKVWFRYPKPLRRRHRETECYIEDVEKTQRVCGRVKCDSRDVFQKPVGRKKALTKAIAFLPRPVRTAIWAEYRKIVKRPW